MPPRPERAHLSVRADGQDVGMTIDEPLRRRGRGRTHDDIEPFGCERFDGAIEPAPIEFARRRFDAAPCKLGDPYLLDAERFHPRGVVLPHGFWPVFGVIADA